MTKKMKARIRKTDRSTTRREFFRSAGRGTLILGGVALVGSGATTSSGCGDDDNDGSAGNSYGAVGSSCTDSCEYASDGVCDDGGPGAVYAACDLGTDCSDCGPR